jgi:2-polyprenyl-6-methoxyphenol hydroxylase-like FAD-dependent oxidoreductase
MVQRKRAVVMGGSMAGLLATRVLSDFFDEVVLLERDAFPATAVNRRGVPQGRHTHGLLASGGQVLNQLFPGIDEELIREGAVPGDIGLQGRWFNEGGCLAQFPSGLRGFAMTRPLLENIVRKRVLSLRNVLAKEDTQVQGLAMAEDRSCVKGVQLADEVLEADLTLDATGRGSRTPQWLEEAGYAKPKEERVEVALGYTTRFFRRRASDLDGDIVVVIPPTPTGKRGGVMLAQEGDRWTVTLVAHFGNYPPEDLSGFLEFARTIPAPYIYEVIRNAEPLGEPVSLRFPASSRRRYEQLGRFPGNYLVIGDAISSFNPIYGQGMSVAALQAQELAAALKDNSPNLAQRFFSRVAKVVDIPWAIAVGNDLRMPQTVGPRNAGVNVINWYMSKLHRAAHHDPVPAMAFHRVANLLAPPPTVMHPRVAWRVLRGNLWPGKHDRTLSRSRQRSAGV